MVLLSLILQSNAYAIINLEDVTTSKDVFYRLGTTDTPEVKFDFDIQPTIQPTVKKEIAVEDYRDLTYADLSIKKMTLEISKELEIE